MAGRKAKRAPTRGKGRKRRSGNGKKATKMTVAKQNQFRTEYKDRISPTLSSDIKSNPSPWNPDTHGPLNSQILLPHALFEYWTQGTSNGQIDGNQINAKFLNMKLEMDFSDLPAIVRSTGDPAIPQYDQNYHIVIRQCLILDDISEHLDKTYTNSNSRRTQFAFDSIATTPLELVANMTKRALNRQLIKSDYLSYQRRQDTKVRVLKKIHVKGNLNKRFNTENITAVKVEVTPTDSDEFTVFSRPYPTPNQYFSFNWKMPKEKMTLQPVIGTTSGDPPVTQLVGHWPGKAWIPCVVVTCERDVVDHDIDLHPLRLKQISHFTYTDN